MSPALAGGFLTAAPPGKSLLISLSLKNRNNPWTGLGSRDNTECYKIKSLILPLLQL